MGVTADVGPWGELGLFGKNGSPNSSVNRFDAHPAKQIAGPFSKARDVELLDAHRQHDFSTMVSHGSRTESWKTTPTSLRGPVIGSP